MAPMILGSSSRLNSSFISFSALGRVFAHEVTSSSPVGDELPFQQSLVAPGDGVGIDPELDRQLADGRDALSGLPLPPEDAFPNLIRDLQIDALRLAKLHR